MKSVQLQIPVDKYAALAAAADDLLQEIGYYQIRVSHVLDRDRMPNGEGVDHAVSKVAALIYRDDEAA